MNTKWPSLSGRHVRPGAALLITAGLIVLFAVTGHSTAPPVTEAEAAQLPDPIRMLSGQ